MALHAAGCRQPGLPEPQFKSICPCLGCAAFNVGKILQDHGQAHIVEYLYQIIALLNVRASGRIMKPSGGGLDDRTQ